MTTDFENLLKEKRKYHFDMPEKKEYYYDEEDVKEILNQALKEKDETIKDLDTKFQAEIYNNSVLNEKLANQQAEIIDELERFIPDESSYWNEYKNNIIQKITISNHSESKNVIGEPHLNCPDCVNPLVTDKSSVVSNLLQKQRQEILGLIENEIEFENNIMRELEKDSLNETFGYKWHEGRLTMANEILFKVKQLNQPKTEQ